MTLSEKYRENYKTHPSFNFKNPELEVDENMIVNFEKNYSDPKLLKRPEELKESFYNCVSICKMIFKNIQNQVFDEKQKIFFSALELAINAYLEEEYILRGKIIERENFSRDKSDLKRLVELEQDGYFFGNLENEAVDHILKISMDQIFEFRNNVNLGNVTRKDLSVNHGDLVRKISWIVDKQFRKQGIFQSLSDFFGVQYDHTGLSLELSTEKSSWWRNKVSDQQPPKTMYAHLDEAYFSPKSIVYLSKVESDNGPTSCYPGIYKEFKNNALKDIVGRVVGNIASNPDLVKYYGAEYHQPFSSKKFREHFMLIPEIMRFNSHFGWDVQPFSELENYLVGKEKIMIGNPGDFIVFDGAQLLHRGGLITRGERLVLQVVFYPKTKKPITIKLKEKIKQRLEGI